MLKLEGIGKKTGGLFKTKKGKGRPRSSSGGESQNSSSSTQPMVENPYASGEQVKSGSDTPQRWTPPAHFIQVRPTTIINGIVPWSVDGLSTTCAQDTENAKGKLMTARCLKAYRATHAMELTIREGDMVNNVHDVGIKDWLKGSVGGMYGHFPAANVFLLNATVEFSPSASCSSLNTGSENVHAPRILPQIPGQEDQLQYAEVERVCEHDRERSDSDDAGSIYDEMQYAEMNYADMTIIRENVVMQGQQGTSLVILES